MKNLLKSLMFVAIVAMTSLSCTRDLDENAVLSKQSDKNFYTLSFNGVFSDTRTVPDSEGKLSWEAQDSIGLVLVGRDESGEEDSNVDVCAKTDETACKTGTFTANSVSVVSGKLYAYYPYTPYNNPEWNGTSNSYVCYPNKDENGVPTVNENSIWVVLKQGQHQSAANVQEYGRYFTMAAPGVDFSATQPATLSFSPLASVLCFDIYDTSAKYATENIRSVIATILNDSDTPLVGGYKYNLVEKNFDFTTGGRRLAANIIVDTPFAVPTASGQGLLYMAVLPGTRTLKITVNTDKGSHVLTMANPLTSNLAKKGTIKVNLSNAAVEHYILYQTFDLLDWGGDLMYQKIPAGEYYLPLHQADWVGYVADKKMNGEEPFYFKGTDYNCDGSAAFTSTPQDYLVTKNLDGWEYLRVYEHPGYIKCASASAGYSFTTPKLSGVGETPSNIELSFKVVHRYGCNDNLVVSVIGPGEIGGATSKTIELVKPAAMADVPSNISTEKLTIIGATSETQIKFQNEDLIPKAARTNFDDIIVVKSQGPVQLPPVDVVNMKREVTSTSFTITWDAVNHAKSYEYEVTGAELPISGETTNPTLTVNNLTPDNVYTVRLRAVTGSPDYITSEYATATIRCKAPYVSGDILFKDTFTDWVTVENTGSAGEVRAEKFSTLSPEFQAMFSAKYALDATLFYLYFEPAANYQTIFLGRAYNDGKCFGMLQVLSSAVIPTGVTADVVFEVSVASRETWENKVTLRYIDANGVVHDTDCLLEPDTASDWKKSTDKCDKFHWQNVSIECENFSTDCELYILNKDHNKTSQRSALKDIKISVK